MADGSNQSVSRELIEAGCGAAERKRGGRFGRCVPRAVLLLVFCGLQPFACSPIASEV